MSRTLQKLGVEAGALWRKLTGRKKRARAEADAGFQAALASLGPGDLAIDLGANLGDFTAQMAATGADVIAFEPDPHAFEQLQTRLAGADNVELLNAAASDKAGTFTLYRHKDFAASPDKKSTASSLLTGKRSVSETGGVEVEVIDFASFLEGRARDVKLLKVDIEGAEVALFEKLFESGKISYLAHVFVETHERILPELAARTKALKARGLTVPTLTINWDWR